ncbi:potassium channel protein [Candidatus Woesebacteria bacterium]|nr:MAG: potassium channel protein [Candidatus Woesebacteria bacterium]
MNPFKRLAPILIILLVVVVTGTIGYQLIEGWSFLDSIYMVIITLFTVGFQEVHSFSQFGRVFTIFIIVVGVGTAVYAASLLVEIIVEGEILGYGRRRKMEKIINEMKDHYIICGFGRTGHQVAEEFDAARVPYVVVDRKQKTEEELGSKGIPYIIGDIINDNNLVEAGIKTAKGLISAADSDVANVFVTLSARALNPELYIVARASEIEVENKLKMAGANRVILPYYISGKRIAAYATRPVTSDFLDMVMHGESLEFSLSEITVPDTSSLLNKTLSEAKIREKSGALVIAIRKVDGSFNLQPQSSSTIEKRDIFVVIGTQEQVGLLDNMLR